MMLTLVFVLLVFVFLLALTLPFKRSDRDDTYGPSAAITVYRAQLSDLEADQKAGRIQASEAQTARIEIERRILRLADKQDASDTDQGLSEQQTKPKGRVWVLSFAGLGIAGAVFLYLLLGSPGAPAQLGARVTAGQALLEPGGQSFDEVVAILDGRMQEVPTDPEPRRFMLQVTQGLQDYGRYADTALELSDIEPDDPQWRIAALNGFIQAGRGQMTPAARLVLARFLRDFPDHPAALFHLARTRALDGDSPGARLILENLITRGPDDAPWMTDVKAALAQLSVPEVSAVDQDAMVRSMVDRLAARLAENPDDREGWERLAQSRLVLGGAEAAIKTLEDAITANPQNRDVYDLLLDRLRATGNL